MCCQSNLNIFTELIFGYENRTCEKRRYARLYHSKGDPKSYGIGDLYLRVDYRDVYACTIVVQLYLSGNSTSTFSEIFGKFHPFISHRLYPLQTSKTV